MAQTTMKIDTDLLSELRGLATESYRSPQQQLRYLVDQAKGKLRSNKTFDSDMALDMMDSLIEDSERGVMSEAEQTHIQNLLDSGVELFGENEKGEFVKYSGSTKPTRV